MRLKEFRLSRKLSQADAAAAIGVSQVTISRYESGELVPRQPTMRRIMAWSENQVTAADFYSAPEAAA